MGMEGETGKGEMEEKEEGRGGEDGRGLPPPLPKS